MFAAGSVLSLGNLPPPGATLRIGDSPYVLGDCTDARVRQVPARWSAMATDAAGTGRNLPARAGSNELERQIAGRLAGLQRELGPEVPADLVAARGRYHADRLVAEATITDFIPQLVYRATKDDLLRGDTPEQATPAAA